MMRIPKLKDCGAEVEMNLPHLTLSSMLPEDKIIFSQNDLPLLAFSKFNEMRETGDLCDVTFRVGDQLIPAHRLVLAANIPYFRAMFLSNMVECSQTEIDFQGMKYDTFASLISFAYGCKIEISVDNVMCLTTAASFLQMDELCDTCCDFISGKIRLDNVLDIREFANAHGLLKLQQKVDEYLLNHFTEVCDKEQFLDLPFLYFRELISRDELVVPSEEFVFQVVMSWVKRSVERENTLPDLLTAVRMTLLSYRYLSKHVALEELIQKSTACQVLLEEAKDHRLLRGERSACCSFVTRQRRQTNNSEDLLYAVCIKEDGFPYIFVERFDLKIRRWTLMEGKTMYVEDTTVAAIGKKIYVVGGRDRQGSVLNIVQVYDSELDAWSTVARLKEPKRLIAVAVFCNQLYACGGKTQHGTTNEVECYNSAKDEWTVLPPMLQYRSAASATACGMYVYVLGGCGGDFKDSNLTLGSVERYDPEIKQWSIISEINFVPYRCCVASINGRIYAHSEDFIAVYDPSTEKWNKIFKERNKRCGLSTVAFGQKLYVVEEGGIILIYDTQTCEWSDPERVPGKAHVISIVAVL